MRGIARICAILARSLGCIVRRPSPLDRTRWNSATTPQRKRPLCSTGCWPARQRHPSSISALFATRSTLRLEASRKAAPARPEPTRTSRSSFAGSIRPPGRQRGRRPEGTEGSPDGDRGGPGRPQRAARRERAPVGLAQRSPGVRREELRDQLQKETERAEALDRDLDAAIEAHAHVDAAAARSRG